MDRGLTIGFLAGLAVACGGAIKDAPYEGFKPLTFIRSPIVGAIVGYILNKIYPRLPSEILFLASIAGERIVVEGYKLIRALQKKYKPKKFEIGEWGVPPEVLYGIRVRR